MWMQCMCSKLASSFRLCSFICQTKHHNRMLWIKSRSPGRAKPATEACILRSVTQQQDGQGKTLFAEYTPHSGSQCQSRGASLYDLPCMALSVDVYKSLLILCAKNKVLVEAKTVYAHLVQHGMEFTSALGEYVVYALVKCGGLEDARHVFDMLPYRSTSSWTAMISGYTAVGQGRIALGMYQRMQEGGLEPDKHTLLSLLRACGSLMDLAEGKRMHSEAVKYGFEPDAYVGSSLVCMYGKCGSIVDARRVFDGLSQRNVVLWTVMLAAYAQQGQAEKALRLYAEMREEGTNPDVQTFLSAVQACGLLAEKEAVTVVAGKPTKVKALEGGKAIHTDAQMMGFTSNVFVGNTLISMYGKCGSIRDAQSVFDGLCHKDVVSWSALLVAYVQNDQPGKALQLYELMQHEGRSPNDVTFVSVLHACGILAEKEDAYVGQFTKFNSLQRGKAVHADLFRTAYTSEVQTGNSLVSMYSKCGSILDAQYVFEGLSQRNVVSWTVMLTAFAQQGQEWKALKLYQQMQEEGVSPDHVTFVSVLHACGMLAEKDNNVVVIDKQGVKTNSLERGKAIQADVHRKGYNSDVVGNALVSLYGKCGSLADSWYAFNRLSNWDVVSWTAIVNVYAQQGQARRALQLYTQMQEAGTSPNDVTLVCVLQACSYIGSLEMCRQIHRTLVSKGLGLRLIVATTLIHAYGRCGSMVDAQAVFDLLVDPDVVTWTALIAGYAREGEYAASLQHYEEMLLTRMIPNGVTFLSLLCACSHAGFVDKGVDFFQSMSRDYSLIPEIEHCVTMVDLLGRAGYFARLEDLLSAIPLQPNLSMWLCLLCACRTYGMVLLGRHAFESAVCLEPRNAAAYSLMSNIYCNAGLWDSAYEVNMLEQRAGVWTKSAESWIENGQDIHGFSVEDRNHPEEVGMYELLEKVTSHRVVPNPE